MKSSNKIVALVVALVICMYMFNGGVEVADTVKADTSTYVSAHEARMCKALGECK